MVGRKNAKSGVCVTPSWRNDGAPASDSGRFYRALLENTGDIVTLLDENGIILFQSSAVIEVLGYDGTRLVGTSVLDGIHFEDRERVRQRLEKCVGSPDWVSMETFRLPHRDGSWRWMEARAKNLLEDADVGAILCVSRDVTEARRLQHQLHEAERFARFGHWRWVKGAPSPTWSDGVLKILDHTAPTMSSDGDWYSKLIHPDDRNELLSKFLDAFETKEAVLCTSRFLARDGTYRYIKTHAYAEPDARDEIGALVGLAEDVTQEVMAQESLQRSETKYRLIAERASDIIHHIAPDGDLLYLSPSLEAVLGYAPEDFLLFSSIDDKIHPDDRPRLAKAYSKFVLHDSTVRFEYRLRHKAGHYVWVESTMRAVRSPDGKMEEIIGMTRDMTERKKHEIELMEARERAEAASRTKSRFLANMSHELRTPLNAIIGFSDMLQLEMFGKLGNPRYVEYAQLINESGGLLLDLISDILDMSKIEAGKYDLHCEPVCVESVIEQALKLVRGRAEASGLALRINLTPGVSEIPLIADARALKQILINLLSNAVKFTPQGGRISLGAMPIDGGIRFTVEDTGRGIAKNHIPRLAHAFEQVSDDAELSKQGTGLGLALVRSLAELHGGSILIESELGQGTCVSVDIPAVAGRQAQAAQ